MLSSIISRQAASIILFSTILLSQFKPIYGQQAASKNASLLQETLISLRAFSLHPPYVEENLSSRWWNFGGDCYVEVMNYVRLASDRQSKQGWLFSRVPFTSVSWEVEFEFKIHGHTSSLYGDGFAFWLVTDRESPGPVFGHKDKWTGLGIFFDTYSNGRHPHSFPYVYGIVNDGTQSYQHDNDGFEQQMGGCTADIRNIEHPTKAKVRYARNEYVQVELNIRGLDLWETCFMAPNITLPTPAYLGFSAWTGDVSDNHDILRVWSSALINPVNMAAPPPPSTPNSIYTVFAPKSGSFLMHFYNALFWLVIVILVATLSAGAYFAFASDRKSAPKRF